ncbi:MAG: hypothetical protein M4579_006396 [Chaenotheca gracillima]|nr:MAG: hypothetical protein M4579_006396 [Chaenotheca gracillima]
MAAHVITPPKWILGIRIAQSVIALIILALVAYSTSVFGYTNMVSAYGLNLFTALATLIITSYLVFTPMFFPALYNLWAQLALEIFLVIFWIISFGILASYSATFFFYDTSSYYCFDCYKGKRDLGKRSEPGSTAWQTGAAAAGMGGIEFILFVITLVVFSIEVHRYRTGIYAGNTEAGINEPKTQTPTPAPQAFPEQPVPQAQQQYAQPQAQYPVQNYPQQPQQQTQEYQPQYQQTQPQQQPQQTQQPIPQQSYSAAPEVTQHQGPPQ